MPTPQQADGEWLWDAEYVPRASAQHRRRLARDPAALARLIELLEAEQRLAGKVRHLTPELGLSELALFFSGAWRETDTPVLAKLDPTPREYFWLTAPGMSAAPVGAVAADAADPDAGDAGVVPTIFASGDSLGGAPLRWVVMERLPHRLVGNPGWEARWEMIARAGARFQAVAAGVPDPLQHCERVGVEWFRRGLTVTLERDPPPGTERFLERLLGRLDRDWRWLIGTCPQSVLVGDLHLGNALCRTPPPGAGRALLIDPIPRFGPWAFDPAYCQIISANRDVGLVARFARCRAEAGLPAGAPEDLPRAAALLLAWLASSWWNGVPRRREDRNWVAQTARYIEAAGE